MSFLNKTREFIHETVKTPEQREAEKSTQEKLTEGFNKNAEVVHEKVTEGLQDAKEFIDDGIHKAGDAITDAVPKTDDKKDQDGNLVDTVKDKAQMASSFVGDKINETREAIYEATKSPEGDDKPDN